MIRASTGLARVSLLVALALIGAGTAAIVVAVIEVSREGDPAFQLPFVASGVIGGVGAIGIGVVVIGLQGIRLGSARERRELMVLRRRVRSIITTIDEADR
jgi:hypothetical protein